MDKLFNWCIENKLKISESKIKGSDIIFIEDVGKFLYVKPYENKIIDEDFSFILGDDEFDILENNDVDFILFSFGGRFYYSKKNRGKNKYNEVIYIPEFNDFKYLGETSDDTFMRFSHLGIHTEYEIMNGSGSCELWAKKAKFLHCDAIGICDKNTLAGAMSFQVACDKNGLRPIIGETISVAINYDSDKENQELFELILFPKNYDGWKNLLTINREINVNYNKFIPDKRLMELGMGIYLIIPKNSEFNYKNNDMGYCRRLLDLYKSKFEDVYYQIDTCEYKSEQLFKRHLSNIDFYLTNFYKKGLKPILINDSYYLDKEESGLKSMLNKVDGVVNPESDDQYFKSLSDTFRSYEEWSDVQPLFSAILDGVNNSNVLVDKIEFKINVGTRKIPKFECKDVVNKFYSEINKGWNERISGKVENEQLYFERLENECNVIVPNDLCDYFMILWDIMKWCGDNGIRTGSGRGSVCGSLVAYLLHITDVDPLKYGLLFERFLNETRVSGERAKSADSMPDIDVDFPTEYRDCVKEYIKCKYGYEYTCAIGTYTRMKLKTCIKDFGKIKGLSFDYTNKLTKDIDDQIEYTWGDLIEYASKSKSLFKFVQENPDIVHYTKYALLQPKAESVHPSAVIIVPKKTVDGTNSDIDIWEWLPVKSIDGVLVSEWEGKYIDKSGFLKEDILGLSQLDKFKNVLDLVKDNSGYEIDLNAIPLDDDETYKYFRRGWNEDVFQFGTAGLMNYCRQVKPNNLEHLIAMTALFRPGPMELNAHQDFADIKNGKKKPKFDVGMEDITGNTFGLYVFQEQIMQAVIVGGLTKVESDVLRTTIKKKDVKTLAGFGDKFKNGYMNFLSSKGIENVEKYADKVWEKLLAFSGYGFNKSHAAAYSIMSYWSQYLKVHFPLEFWTTSLQFAKESEIPYRLAELKKTGVEIEIRPPDVNHSFKNFNCDYKNNRIFFSLTKIKGVGDVAVDNIIATRNSGGEFFSLEEFVSRVPSKVNKAVIKSLIISGAFDLVENISNERDRKRLLKKYLETKNEELPEMYNGSDSNSNAFWILEQKKLTGFGEVDYENMIKQSIPNKRIASMYISDSDFLTMKENKEVTIAGKLIYFQLKEIKSGTMCTINIDCNNTIIPVLIWPDAYEKIGENIEDLKGNVIAINGNVAKDKFKNEKKLYSNSATKLYVLGK